MKERFCEFEKLLPMNKRSGRCDRGRRGRGCRDTSRGRGCRDASRRRYDRRSPEISNLKLNLFVCFQNEPIENLLTVIIEQVCLFERLKVPN